MIKELEKLFNDCDIVQDKYIVDISCVRKEQIVTLSVFEKETEELLFDLQVQVYYVEDMYELVTYFINQIYKDYLNQLEENIKGWDAFIKRKVKSLRLWSERNDENKIVEINADIVDRYTQMENAKKERKFYIQFVRIFYAVRGKLDQAVS